MDVCSPLGPKAAVEKRAKAWEAQWTRKFGEVGPARRKYNEL